MEDEDKLLYGEEGGGGEEDSQDVEATREEGVEVEEAPVTEEIEVRKMVFCSFMRTNV